jgi:hypothetical protein
MVRLGQFGKEKEKMSFKDWLNSEKRKEGIYRVIVLFPPSRYPSYTLVFEAEGVDVRLSIKAEKFREAMKDLGITIGKRNLPSLLLTVDNYGYGLDVDVDNPYNMLLWKGTYWRLEQEDINGEDDGISF